MAILTKIIKNFHKSQVEGLKKLLNGTCLSYDLFHFKGCHFTLPGFIQISVVGISNFLAFLTCLMIPIKISCHLSRHNFLLRGALKNCTVIWIPITLVPSSCALAPRNTREAGTSDCNIIQIFVKDV